MFEIIALISSVYGLVVVLLLIRGIIFDLDTEHMLRQSIFWPIYTIRWFITNAILAVAGK